MSTATGIATKDQQSLDRIDVEDLYQFGFDKLPKYETMECELGGFAAIAKKTHADEVRIKLDTSWGMVEIYLKLKPGKNDPNKTIISLLGVSAQHKAILVKTLFLKNGLFVSADQFLRDHPVAYSWAHSRRR